MTREYKDSNGTNTHKSSQAGEELKAKLLFRLPEVLRDLLPAGVAKGDTFTVGDVQGNKGKSLSIALHGPKAGQWHDFATDEGGDILHLWAKVKGLDTHRDFPEVLESIQAWLGKPYRRKILPFKIKSNLGPVTGQWDYTDANGELLARVYRYDPPEGKQYRPWDAKKGSYGLPNPRPLYNQSGLKPSNTIILVEGEKAAQALIDAGFCATTAMSGAMAPIEKTDWSPLKGKHVLIWPDNDEPGRTYAESVGRYLYKKRITASVEILQIPEDTLPKWDGADAAAEGLDIQVFLDTAQRTLVKPKPDILAYSVGHYLDDSSPMPSDIIAPRLLTPGGLLVLGGAPKVGKSDLLICWLASLAAGTPFLGMTPPRPLKIFYLQTEIGYHYLRERLQHLPIPKELMPLVSENLVITPQIRFLLDEKGVEKVVDTITNFFDPTTVDLIVIDPLCNVYDGGKTAANENDNSAMLAFLQDRVEALRHQVNPEAGVMLVHHTKKLDKKSIGDDPFQAFSGASAIRRFYTAGIIMFRPDETQSARKLIFEVRNGPAIPAKIIDKINGEWCESDFSSERLLKKEYGQRLDAERRRRQDVILQMLFNKAQEGICYTPSQFSQTFENDAGLGGKNSIRERIDVLATKGYIKFNKDNVAKSKYGIMCIEDMEVPTKEGMKPLLPTHFKHPGNGAVLPVENPSIWVYMDGSSP